MKNMLTALLVLLTLTVVTGIAYPLAVTVIAQTCFRDQANGSLLTSGDRIVGSRLIGQAFAADRYFWPRPSATGYNPMPSGGSNLSPASNALKNAVAERSAAFRQAHSLSTDTKVPLEMLFASGSGLDPDISTESAMLQAGRVASARGLSEAQSSKLTETILAGARGGSWGAFKSDCVNTVLLNRALDSLAGTTQ